MILMIIHYLFSIPFVRKNRACSRNIRLVVLYDNRYRQPLEYVEEIITRMDTFGYTSTSLRYALESVKAPDHVRAICYSSQDADMPAIFKKIRRQAYVSELAVEFDFNMADS